MSNNSNTIEIYVFTRCTKSPVAVECDDQTTAQELAEKALWECECPASIGFNEDGVWKSASVAVAKNSEAHQQKIASLIERKKTRVTRTEDTFITHKDLESPLPFATKVFDAPTVKKYLSGAKGYHLCCSIERIPAPRPTS